MNETSTVIIGWLCSFRYPIDVAQLSMHEGVALAAATKGIDQIGYDI